MTHYLIDGMKLYFTTFKSKPDVKVCSLSPHIFRLSDGTIVPEQSEPVVNAFNLKREKKYMFDLHGMGVYSLRFVLSQEQEELLHKISRAVDLIIAPMVLITGLYDCGVRGHFKNVVAFNATAETQRAAPSEKIVDIENWSY